MTAIPEVQPDVQSLTLPAPIGGLNTVDSGASTPPTDCVVLYNMIAAEYGLRARLGWAEWVTGLGASVGTVIPFTGSQPANNRLFAATSAGIYDCSSSTTTPTLLIAFADSSQQAGIGTACVFVNSGGAHFCLYTDEQNGYYVYTESTSTWLRVTYGGGGTQVTGTEPDGVTQLNPAQLCQVMIWANRVWFVQRNTGYAWYGGIGSLYGTLTPFSFGGRFRAGGELRGLFNWTIDGGSGVTNSLVGISGGGDVVVYQGTDPSDATKFGLVGVWFVGGVPAGRRIATDYGGDLLILASVGVVTMSKLSMGNPVFDRSQYATHKIGNLFNQLVLTNASLFGWHIRIHPSDNALIVNVPQVSGTTIQLVMSLLTKGWSQYRDLPNITSAEPYSGTLYFGTDDGRVCVSQNYVDAALLSNPSAATAIKFSMISAFQNLGSPKKKRVHHLRPTFIASSPPAYVAAAKFNYDFTELPAVLLPSNVPDGVTTVYTSAVPLLPSDQIFVDRVLQIFGVDYTLSGNTITFLAGAIPQIGATIQLFKASDSARTPVALGLAGNGWDSSIWDSSTWGGDPSPTQTVTGSTGMGQEIAVAISGACVARTSLAGIDVMYSEGGLL